MPKVSNLRSLHQQSDTAAEAAQFKNLSGVGAKVAASLIMGMATAPGAGTHMYYRAPGGYVFSDTSDTMSRYRAFGMGRMPLNEYGLFSLYPYTVNNPLETLFMRGGAHELTVDQIVENGFHIDPPLIPSCGMVIGEPDPGNTGHAGGARPHVLHRAACWDHAVPVEFPQLVGADLSAAGRTREDVTCTWCGEEFATIKARDQHVGVMHEDKVQMSMLAQTMASAAAGQSTAIIELLIKTLAESDPDKLAAILNPIQPVQGGSDKESK